MAQLDFRSALSYLKEGGIVVREAWERRGWKGLIRQEEYIWVLCEDGNKFLWQPDTIDLFSDDWVFVFLDIGEYDPCYEKLCLQYQ